MERRLTAPHAGRVTRIVITWIRHSNPAGEQADAWALLELRRLLELPEVERVELTRLEPACEQHGHPGDYLCELWLREGADVAACLRRPECDGWLCDLRMLGMRPALGVAYASDEVR